MADELNKPAEAPVTAMLGVIGAGGFAFASRFRLHGAEPAND